MKVLRFLLVTVLLGLNSCGKTNQRITETELLGVWKLSTFQASDGSKHPVPSDAIQIEMEWEFAKDHSFSHRTYPPTAKVITHSGNWQLTNDLLVLVTSTNTYLSESGRGVTDSVNHSLDPRLSLSESWTPNQLGAAQAATTNFLRPQRVWLEGDSLAMQPANRSPNVTYYFSKAKTGL